MRRSGIGLLVTYFAALAIITWDELKHKQRIPHPENYVRAGIVWAILGVVAEIGAPEVAGIFGLGLVVAMLYVYFQSAQSTVGGAENPEDVTPIQ